jgi:GNAT superfamily N-acetyltransferase
VSKSRVNVRPLEQEDLGDADRILRAALGTSVALPQPDPVTGDAGYVRPRFSSAPSAAFAAEVDGAVVGSNFAARWGTFAFCGPLTVRRDLVEQNVAEKLLEPVLDLFERWNTRLAGLFTFADNAKHHALYEKAGFRKRELTLVGTKNVAPKAHFAGAAERKGWSTFCEAPPSKRESLLLECRAVAETVFPGLDLGSEISGTAKHELGDTILVRDDAGLAAFAVCHTGPASEAGSGNCYVKFGAARSGARAEQNFERLLEAIEAFAREREAHKLIAGVNTSRTAAYKRFAASGFHEGVAGFAMLRPNQPGFNRPEAWVLDDWR